MARLQASAAFLRALDANAAVLSGAKCYVYRNRTTTPVSTFSDASLVTPQAHPVVADSAGRFASIYLPGGAYTIKVTTSAGALVVQSDDNIATGGSGNRIIDPADYGAVGNGEADDGAALNLALDALRTTVNGSFWAGAPAFLDGRGRDYKTTISLDATEISGFSWGIRDLRIFGACAGEVVLDTTGSRGYHFSDINIFGDQTNTPTVGWQAARSTGGGNFGFCDLNLVERVHIDGYFSTAPHQFYGQESTTYEACRFWTKSPSGAAGIIGGYDTPSLSSDYATPVTGGRSNIDIRFIGCEWRYLPPTGTQATITGISNANPGVITCAAGHSLANGDTVCLSALGAMTTLNSGIGIVQNATATTFEIVSLDTTSLGAFSGSGYATKAQTSPALSMFRLSNARFLGCYIQSFGQPAIGFSWPDSSVPHGLDIDGLLVEGAPSSYIHFTQGSTNKSIEGFRFSTPENLSWDAVFTLDAGSAGNVALGNGVIRVDQDPYGTRKAILDAQASKFSLPGTDVFTPTLGAVNRLALASARGRFYGYDSATIWDMGSYQREPIHYAPTLTYDSGTAWSVNATTGAFTSGAGPRLIAGSGTPEGAVTAPVGSLFMRSDGGAGTSIYVKQSGTGNTGWVGK